MTVGGQPTIMPLQGIDAIGIVAGRLPLAIQRIQLDEHVGDCAMLQIRHGAPNGVPAWTFHETLRRLPNFGYALGAPDHTYGTTVVGGPAVRFELIAIGAATRCPMTQTIGGEEALAGGALADTYSAKTLSRTHLHIG